MQTITLAGRLGSDAKRGSTQGGDVVANFSIAVDSRQGKEKVTNWWRCAMWGKRADALGKYLTKGTSVAVTGEFSLSEYDGKPQLNCRVSELTLLGGGNEPSGDQGGTQQRTSGGGGDGWTGQAPPNDLDDDIPFITRNSIY